MNEPLIHTTTWMNLRRILNERSQTQRVYTVWFCFMKFYNLQSSSVMIPVWTVVVTRGWDSLERSVRKFSGVKETWYVCVGYWLSGYMHLSQLIQLTLGICVFHYKLYLFFPCELLPCSLLSKNLFELNLSMFEGNRTGLFCSHLRVVTGRTVVLKRIGHCIL